MADALKPLRDTWIPLILNQGLRKEFLVHVEQQRPNPPFSDDCINQFRDLFSSWLQWIGPSNPNSRCVLQL